jgi:hypothetical protein
MSQIQYGIQSAHLVGDLSVKYENPNNFLTQVYKEWARKDKTMIILSAVNLQGLKDVYESLSQFDSEFPVGCFHEDEESLGGLLTCVGIIVPETIYGAISFRDAFDINPAIEVEAIPGSWVYFGEDGQRRVYNPDHKFWNLINTLKSYRLA